MTSALLACALSVCAADAPAKPADGPARKPDAAQRQRPTQEEMQARREKALAMMKARQEAVRTKVVAALREAGLDEAKAAETAEKIQRIYMESRMPRHAMAEGRRPPRPAKDGPRRPQSPEAK